MMEFTAEMIAGFLGGEVIGDKNAKVHTVSSIEEGKAGSLTYLTNPKYEPFIYTTGASIVLVDSSFTPSRPVAATLVRVADAGACVLRLLEMYNAAKPRRTGISPRASVAEGTVVGEECYIGDFAVVEAGVRIGRGCQIYPQVYLGQGTTVGDGTILYPGVKVYEGCTIGSRCILHAGAVIGADGFGFLPNAEGGFDKIPQLGNVVIEDDVEIGANTCIDRAKTDSTVIRRGVKLDNLIQIGHNVQIGENTVSSAQTGHNSRSVRFWQTGQRWILALASKIACAKAAASSPDISSTENAMRWEDFRPTPFSFMNWSARFWSDSI